MRVAAGSGAGGSDFTGKIHNMTQAFVWTALENEVRRLKPVSFGLWVIRLKIALGFPRDEVVVLRLKDEHGDIR